MLIGIDAREICGKPTGVGRYLHGLFAQWAALLEAQSHQFLLFAPNTPLSSLPSSRFDLRIVSGGNGTRWEQTTLAAAINRTRPDVFFAPAYSAPLRASVPLVVAMHDLSFILHPEWFRWRERVRRGWLARRSCRKARRVLTLTEYVKGQIVARLGVPPSHVYVIPPGVELPREVTDGDGTARREPLVLFVGSIFNRRRLPTLIRAFDRVARGHPDATLEIVGENRTHPHQDLDALVRKLGLQGRARVRTYQDDRIVAELYKRAGVFAFLSEYEGFGFPPLEALASGVPVVLTDTPVAREVFGEAAHYVPSGDVDGVARQLETLLFDARARRLVLERAPAQLARYSWQRAARETLAALEEAATISNA